MKKRLFITLFVMFFSLSLMGCGVFGGSLNPFAPKETQSQSGTKTGTTQVSVKEDLNNYINSGLSNLKDLEQTALDSYTSVSGDNYTNDSAMYQEMKTVTVPKYTEFYQKLSAMKPKTKEVQDVHSLYVTGAKYQLDAFKQILTALEKQDADLINDANKKLDAGREKINAFLEEINTLAAANSVDTNRLDTTSSASLPDLPAPGNTAGVSVQDDLLDYINVELVKVTDLENEAVSAYESVSGTNYTNDNTMYQTMVNTVIPKYEQFLSILESIEPETQEVMDIHQTFLDGARLQMDGFNLVVEALEKQDRDLVNTANEKLNQGKSYIDQFQSDLQALAQENGVTFK